MTKRVLVVDDDDTIRETFEMTLTGWGYAVTTAASAEEALSRVGRVDPAVMITDVRMPGMSGLELLSAVRGAAPEIDVIVITAFEDMRTAVQAMKAGAFDYLVKPLDLDHIELTLARCVRARTARRRVTRLDALSAEVSATYALAELTGRNPQMIEVYKTVGAVAESLAPVLIRGETGTGKELVARAIHYNSAMASEPFVAVNCTAIPENLLESELFGHVRGAFTGASHDRKGRFELAGTGTVFLDEIGDTTPAFQGKILRVLQEREFTPVGAERPKRAECRVVAATHRDLEKLVEESAFREDLYYRLRVVEIRVPPLRARREDVPLIADQLLRRASAEMHRDYRPLAPDAIDKLKAHDWPGNVRELENVLKRALLLARGSAITADDLIVDARRATAARSSRSDWALATVERDHVTQVLVETSGNKRRAARMLGVSRARLDRLIERHHLG